MIISKNWRLLKQCFYLGFSGFLFSCGGGGGSGDGEVQVTVDGETYTITGSVEGLQGIMQIADGNEHILEIASDGAFVFTLDEGEAYDISILLQPSGQSCLVANSTGAASGGTNDILITCSLNSYRVGGSISGLAGELVIEDGDGNSTTISEDGTYYLDELLGFGLDYNIKISSQPANQICSISNENGTIEIDVSNVNIVCVDLPLDYQIQGSIAGLDGALVLKDDAGTELSFTEDGGFTFVRENNAHYTISIVSAPDTQECVVVNGSGELTSKVNNVEVNCVDLPVNFQIQGSISGLDGELVLKDDAGTELSFTEDGGFIFIREINSLYTIEIDSAPITQNCVVVNGSGELTANVNNVEVECLDILPVQDSAWLEQVLYNIVEPVGDGGTAIDMGSNIVWTGEAFFTYFSDADNRYIQKSTDGESWLEIYSVPDNEYEFNSLFWNGAKLILNLIGVVDIIEGGSSRRVLTSSDGEIWAEEVADIDVTINKTLEFKGQTLGFGAELPGGGTWCGAILTGLDGISWADVTPDEPEIDIWPDCLFAMFSDAVVFKDKVYAISLDFGSLTPFYVPWTFSRIASSGDGLNWSVESARDQMFSTAIAANDDVILRNSLLERVTWNTPIVDLNLLNHDRGTVEISTDGVVWENLELGVAYLPYKIFWTGKEFILIAMNLAGDDGDLFRSTDGYNWAQDDIGINNARMDNFSQSNSHYLLSGSSGSVMSRPISRDAWFDFSGTVDNLNGNLKIKNGEGQAILFNRTGNFSFLDLLKIGDNYQFEIMEQPSGQFCIVSNGSGVVSADVTNLNIVCQSRSTIWQRSSMDTQSTAGNVIWDGSQFVSSSLDGTGLLPTTKIFSSSNGQSWSEIFSKQYTLSQGAVLNSLASSPGGYVALGKDFSLLSDDLLTWDEQNLVTDTGESIQDAYIMHVIWNGTSYVGIGIVDVVGAEFVEQKNLIGLSADGFTWVPKSNLITSDHFFVDLEYYAGNYFILGGNWETGPVLLSSVDLDVWSSAAIDPVEGFMNFYDLAVSDSIKLVVGKGDAFITGDAKVFVSSDDVNWIEVIHSSRYVANATWTGRDFISVGRFGSVSHSVDGFSWVTVNSATREHLKSFTQSGTYYVITGDKGVSLRREIDSATWSNLEGNVVGLSGNVKLTDELGNQYSFNASGVFKFFELWANGASYNLTVSEQPEGQTCTVGSGSGVVSADVTGVTITCVAA